MNILSIDHRCIVSQLNKKANSFLAWYRLRGSGHNEHLQAQERAKKPAHAKESESIKDQALDRGRVRKHNTQPLGDFHILL